ncbi:flagellar hook-basal body protein [Mobilitalea sibirica]|uniref:Flagellar hook-basal body protein n=1 Tax=Mobilitalea sibirica TaxID=1462919 RepID=A0A8J7H5A6_9FIRM|nr:flagellar hook-basal body protein [Mobilitalea sibirica]MBH1942452.1 flagellar hook-basal body protein [Mobilitalea sibirica]
MMRSLWTAASGMITQQTNVDTISNNLANINTTGYKKESAEFKSLLYQTIQEKSYDNNGVPKPVGIQVGLGVRNSAITSRFTQGTLQETGNDFDLAIEGKGFFRVQTQNGEIAYTRNGSFRMAIGVNGATLADSDGNSVLDVNGMPIVVTAADIPADTEEPVDGVDEDQDVEDVEGEEGTEGANEPVFNPSKITISETGALMYPNKKGVAVPINKQISIVQFNNPSGLQKMSNSLLKETEASGEARIEANDTGLQKSKLRQGYLEGSNVQAVDEVVNLIVAQRAYEMNSKIITATDEMLQQANNLR